MSSANPVVLFVAGAAVAVGIWWLMKQNARQHHRREGFNGSKFSNFERDCLKSSDKGNGRYWRSGVDYVSEPQKNPHYMADPHDESLPLYMAKMAPGLQLMPPYAPAPTGGQYTPGCGDSIDVLSDDFSTQKSLNESGNLDYKHVMQSTREDGVYGNYHTNFSLSMAAKMGQ